MPFQSSLYTGLFIWASVAHLILKLILDPTRPGWRIHCGVEVTESSTNKQHSLSKTNRFNKFNHNKI